MMILGAQVVSLLGKSLLGSLFSFFSPTIIIASSKKGELPKNLFHSLLDFSFCEAWGGGSWGGGKGKGSC